MQRDTPKSTAELALLVCAFEESFVEDSVPGFIFLKDKNTHAIKMSN